MEPVLIYTDTSFHDVGAIRTFALDLAFGSDEQNFEASFSEPVLSGGELLYIDGTEYGGVIDSVTQSTDTDVSIYKGRTWHGMLAGKVIQPASGQAYYTVSGDANACIRSVLTKVGLDGILTGRTTSAGISITSYQFERYTNAYDGLLRMLDSVNATLAIQHHDGIIELWAVAKTTITNEADSDILDFSLTDSHRTINHLVCAGQGELQDRVIVDLYADASGNISQTQTLTGVNEIASFYNYNNADSAELIKQGTKELAKYQQGGGADIQLHTRGNWRVGDKLQVRDNRTGIIIVSTIAKKIVKVENGVLSVDYEIGSASAQAYEGGGTAEINLVTPIANGGTGATTVSGALSNLGIGTTSFSNKESYSLANNTSDAVHSVSLGSGKWIVFGAVSFPNNSTGRRECRVDTTSGSSVSVAGGVQVPAVSGAVTVIRTQRVFELSSTTTVYLNALQNSGSSLSVSARLEAIKIA